MQHLSRAMRGAVAVLPALVLTLGGCSQFAARSDHDPGADFGHLHTYAWLPLAEAAPADQLVPDRYIDKRLRQAVDAELRGKGYRPADGAAPDFLLNYRLASAPADAMHRDSGPTLHSAGWYGWPGAERLFTESYDQGTLYLAVLDPGSKRIIWLGAASARLLPHISLEKRVKRVNAAIHRLLSDFPPA
jgi:hypothetical protein